MFSTLSNFGALRLEQFDPNLIQFLAPFSFASFCTFIFNEVSLYKRDEDACMLMVGYISITFLAATFQSINWETTSQYLIFTDILVGQYFVDKFGFNPYRTWSVLVLHLASCMISAFCFEVTNKEEFIERHKNHQLQIDLKTVINMIPEGVIICTKSYREKNPEILLSNREAIKLFAHSSIKKEQGQQESKPSLDIQKTACCETPSELTTSILSEKRLLPYYYLDSEEKYNPEQCKKYKFDGNEAISTDEALTFGEVDRLYQVVPPEFEPSESFDRDELDVIALNLINI